MHDRELNRRGFWSLAALAAAASVAPSLWAQPRLEKTRVAIAVGGKAAFYNLPLTIAEQLGYFKAEGLEVEISDFQGGSRALQAVVGGTADVVSGAYEHTINLQVQGAAVSGLRAAGPRTADLDGDFTQDHAGVQDAWPISGARRLASRRQDSSTNMVANRILLRAGLTAGRCELHWRGHCHGALDGVSFGPDRCHEQCRSGDDHAGAKGRNSHHCRHAHAQGYGGGVWRSDAGRLPVRAREFIQKTSQHGAGPRPTPSCTA